MNRECSSVRILRIREQPAEGSSRNRCEWPKPSPIVGSNPTTPIKPFSIEEARIHAHLCGDGSAWISHEKRSTGSLKKHKRRNIFRDERKIAFTNFCKELLNQFSSDMLKAFNRKCTKVHNGTELRVNGTKHILERLKIPLPFNSFNWFIPPEVLFSSPEVKCEWLRAFFDDEGTVHRKKGVEVEVVNKNGLLQVQKLLDDLRIETTFIELKNSFRLRVRSRSLLRFSQLIGFVHPKKKKRLENIIEERLRKGLINI